ncbi:MAG TPA: hypothetical protein VLF66_16715, partial [Thermoanaerobaculia bacterium]|nr:hypothetical protein [Thermoanaerobaculia bacterium]
MAKTKVQHKTVATPPRLTSRIAAVAVLVALVAAGAVAGWAEWRLRAESGAGSAGGAELDAAARAQALAVAQRLEELALAAARLARDPGLGPALAGAGEADPTAQAALLEDTLDGHQLELVVAGPPPGEAQADGLLRAGGPEEAARALAASGLAERAAAEGRASGAWA